MEKIKASRTLSFLVVLFSYILAFLVAILVFYKLQGLYILIRIFISDVAGTLTIYILSLFLDNASLYDPYWSIQPIVIVWLANYLNGLNLENMLLCIAITYWGIRLTANWAYTFRGLNHIDWRYSMLKKKSGVFYPLVSLFGIQLFPTIIVWGCILPAVTYFNEAKGHMNIITLLGFAISIGAATLQLIADIQVHKFRKSNEDKSHIIRVGLWKYSRHPNYLGEILMWWGVYISMLSVLPDKWYLILGAIANSLMFLFISIPMAEKRLKSYKSGFDEYLNETRMLLPLKRKRQIIDESIIYN